MPGDGPCMVLVRKLVAAAASAPELYVLSIGCRHIVRHSASLQILNLSLGTVELVIVLALLDAECIEISVRVRVLRLVEPVHVIIVCQLYVDAGSPHLRAGGLLDFFHAALISAAVGAADFTSLVCEHDRAARTIIFDVSGHLNAVVLRTESLSAMNGSFRFVLVVVVRLQSLAAQCAS